MLPETQSSESPFALVARNHHRADFAPAAFDIDLSDRAVRAQNRLERWPCADAIAAANPTSPCAVRRRRPSAGANPARQLSLQPVAVGAGEGGNDVV